MSAAHPTAHFSDLVGGAAAPLRELLARSPAFRYTYKARGAIQQVMQGLAKRDARRVALVPAFHCPTVIQPLLRAGFEVRFFGVELDLRVDRAHFLAQMDVDVAAVVLINYFGFENDAAWVAAQCQSAGALLIEDWSHSFLRCAPLRLAGEHGDVAVYSPWKIVPCGVGGIVRALHGGLDLDFALEAVPFKESARVCKRLLEESVMNLAPDSAVRRVYSWLEAHRVARKQGQGSDAIAGQAAEASSAVESSYPEHAWFFASAMPAISRRILEGQALAGMVAARRERYRQWAAALGERAEVQLIHRELDDDTCPWALPILLRGRSGRDRALRSRGVSFFTFGETPHALFAQAALPPAVRERTMQLVNETLCFPIHPQVSRADIEHGVAALDAVIGQGHHA